MRHTRAAARRLAAAGAALSIALLLLSGCAAADAGPTPTSGQGEANDAAAETVERALLEREDVDTVEVQYVDTSVDPENGVVDAVITPGADPQAIAEAAVRQVWQSELAPLSVITVSVSDPQDPPRGASRSIDLLDDAQRAPLEEQYGPRPR